MEAIRDMVENASKIIKERAIRRKEEEYSSEVIDGKIEEFSFKNIKPKKAYLLGASPNHTEEEEEVITLLESEGSFN